MNPSNQNNVPNPYDPSTNNNININEINNRNYNNEENKEVASNPYKVQNDVFNQEIKEGFGDAVNQGDNYNINYNSSTQSTKPEKNNMIKKYIIFGVIIIVIGLLIYFVSSYIK